MARQFSYNDSDRPKWGSDDPRPDRADTTTNRRDSARLAREIHDRLRLSGTHEADARTRSFRLDGMQRVVSRDAVGRLVIDWEKVEQEPPIDWAKESDQPRDRQGRFTYGNPEEG